MKKQQLQDTAAFAVAEAKRLGATDCEIGIQAGESFQIGVRNGDVEELQGSQSRGLELTVFVGQRHATVSSADFRRRSLTRLIRDAIATAKVSDEDPSAGMAEPEHLAKEVPELDLYDPAIERITVADRIRIARQCEAAAMAADPRITQSSGASFSDNRGVVVLANSRGFVGSYAGSMVSISASVVAEADQQMQVGSWYSVSRKLAGLESPELVGKIAGEHAARQLGGRSVASQVVPVVFDPQMAARLVGQFVGAASGAHVYRKSSFLHDKFGQMVASPLVTIVDDPLIPGGLGSRPFDAEALPSRRREIVSEGKLAAHLIGVYAARMLKTAPNGQGTSNLYLQAGTLTPEEIIGSVQNGLYLTGVSGPGFNATTGDYSVGASGFWIENGKLAYPVEGITIASNVVAMFNGIEAIGNDLVFRGGTNAPTVKIRSMTIAGKASS
ncbi:MAG: hypothetical protein K2X77_34090 [Candidatus Obscuribacterales bacterium]|nr:hypothetical protein [Candidatus Obscuribacterales bacterium]